MENTEKIFIEGLIVKAPRENAPDFVKCSLSFKVEEFKTFLDKHINNGWINVNVKTSKGGKWYAELDTWKPTQTGSQGANIDKEAPTDPDSIPF